MARHSKSYSCMQYPVSGECDAICPPDVEPGNKKEKAQIMCQFIQVQEFCPCSAEDKCRRIDEAVPTPFGPRHCVNQTALVKVVCKPRRFIMSHAAFAARECPNTSEGSKAGPDGDSCVFEPAERMCQLCADFCCIPRCV